MKLPSGITVSEPHSVDEDDDPFELYCDIHLTWWRVVWEFCKAVARTKEMGWLRFVALPYYAVRVAIKACKEEDV